MTKKTLLVISLLLVMIFAFAGCAGETFNFTALTVESMSGELTSNGGVSVAYKGYTYFINGNVSSYSIDNTFGEVEYGAIVRVKTANLTNGTFADREIDTSDYPEVEVLAPKAVYTAATGSANSNGIFIFNDRIYYATPSTTRDKEGALQNSYLDIMSVALDGTGTQRMYTVPGNSFNMMLAQNGNNVYAVYVNGENLVSVNITDAKPTETTLSEHVSDVKFIPSKGVAVFAESIPEEGHEDHDHEPTHNSFSVYTVGETEASLLIDGAGEDVSKDVVFTMATVTENYVYFSVASDNAGRDGLYRVGVTSRDVDFDAQYSSLKVSSENLLSSGLIAQNGTEENIVFYNATEHYVQHFNVLTKEVKNMFYCSSAPTFVKVANEKVFYTLSAKLKYFVLEDCLASTHNGTYAREDQNVAVTSCVNAVTWLEYDFYQDYMLYLSTTTGSEVYLVYTDYNDEESEDKVEYFVGKYVNVTTTK